VAHSVSPPRVARSRESAPLLAFCRPPDAIRRLWISPFCPAAWHHGGTMGTRVSSFPYHIRLTFGNDQARRLCTRGRRLGGGPGHGAITGAWGSGSGGGGGGDG